MSNDYKRVIIGSRSSSLAIKQVELFKKDLKSHFKGIDLEERFIKTSADMFLEKKLSDFGNKGLFTKEIDDEQLSNIVDMTVHSLKDLPHTLVPGLDISGFLKREDSRDAIYSPRLKKLADLKENSTIGTSSIRRKCQIKKLRPDLNFKFIRGNVETRIKKVLDGHYDATVLAMAGLKRLGIKENFFPLEIETVVPAAGQGIIAIICRKRDVYCKNLAKFISDHDTKLIANCERSFLKALEGNCDTPIGANARILRDKVAFNFFISNENGNFFIKDKKIFSINQAISKCFDLGKSLKKRYMEYE